MEIDCEVHFYHICDALYCQRGVIVAVKAATSLIIREKLFAPFGLLMILTVLVWLDREIMNGSVGLRCRTMKIRLDEITKDIEMFFILVAINATDTNLQRPLCKP